MSDQQYSSHFSFEAQSEKQTLLLFALEKASVKEYVTQIKCGCLCVLLHAIQ